MTGNRALRFHADGNRLQYFIINGLENFVQ